MPEKPDTDEFLVGKFGFGIIAGALKTSVGTSIVNLTDKQIKLNQLIFHRQENSTNQPVCLSFQLLIRIIIIFTLLMLRFYELSALDDGLFLRGESGCGV